MLDSSKSAHNKKSWKGKLLKKMKLGVFRRNEKPKNNAGKLRGRDQNSTPSTPTALLAAESSQDQPNTP